VGRYFRRILMAAALCCAAAGAQPYELPAEIVRTARASGEIAPLLQFASEAEARGDWDIAADALDEATELRPDDGGLAARRAKAHYKRGPAGKSEAFKIADGLIRAGDDAPADAYFVRGLLYLEQDLPDLAREDFDALLARDAESVPGHIVAAVLKVYAGDVLAAETALAALGQAAMPFDAETRDMVRRALLTFERDRYTFPDTAEHHAAYARLLYRAARVPDAILAARRAATLDSANKDLWRFIGQMHAQLGQQEQAESAFKKAE